MITTNCKICNKEIRNKYKSTVNSFCSQQCRAEGIRQRQVGKKRPAHSAKMKALVESKSNERFNNTLMKKGQLFNSAVNSIEFKRTILDKLNIEYNDQNLDIIYNQLQKQKLNNVKVYRKKINNAILRYADHPLVNSLRIFASMDDGTLEKIYYTQIHGIFTALNLQNRGKKKIPCICSKGTVYVRSSYEANYIKFFDEMNIEWQYEPAWFRLSNNKIYLPDFLIKFDNKKLWVEVKGAFWGHQQYDEYMINIVDPFKKIIAPEKYLLTLTQFPTISTFAEEVNRC